MQNMIAGKRRGQTCNLFFDLDHDACKVVNLRATTGGYDAPTVSMTQKEMEDLTAEITYQVAEEIIAAAELYMSGQRVAH